MYQVRDSVKPKTGGEIGYLYKVTYLPENKVYIGKRTESVWDKHYYGGGTYLKRALRKYGWENFRMEFLEWCYSAEELNRREQELIAQYNCRTPHGYNISEGGDGPHTGVQMSEAAKLMISWRNKGQAASNVNWTTYGGVMDSGTGWAIGLGYRNKRALNAYVRNFGVSMHDAIDMRVHKMMRKGNKEAQLLWEREHIA